MRTNPNYDTSETLHTPYNLPYHLGRNPDAVSPGFFVLAKAEGGAPFIVARPNVKPRKVRNGAHDVLVRRGWHTRKEALLALIRCNEEKAQLYGPTKTNPPSPSKYF